MGKVQGELIHPQGRPLIGVVQSNPVNVVVLPVQPFHSLPFSLLSLLLLAHFHLGKVLNCGTGGSSIRRHTSSATAHTFFPMTLLLCASSSDVERDLTSSSESPCRRLCESGQLISLPVIFCLGGGGGRVRCFCVGICEGSCINPFCEVGGPRLFSQKISKIPRPTPPPHKKRTFPKKY